MKPPGDIIADRPAFVWPAAVLAAGAFAGILAASWRTTVELGLCIATVCTIFFFYRKQPRDLGIFACTAAIFFALTAWRAPVPAPAGEATVRGVCTEVRKYPSSQRLLVRTPDSGILRVNIIDILPDAAVGDVVEIEGEIAPTDKYRDIPFMRMEETGDRAGRVSGSIVADARSVRITGQDNSLRYRLLRGRRDLCDAIYSMPLSPRAAQILATSLLGERNIEPEIRESFQLSGLSHLLCVSGFHVAFIAGIIILLLMPLSYIKPWFPERYIIITVLVWLYAFFVGFGSSTVRAAIMITFFALAKLAQLKPHPLNTLCVAFAAVLLIDPFQLYSAGFQLSFSAVAGLIVLAPRLNPVPGRYKRQRRYAELFVTPLAAILGTLPVMVMWFGQVPLLALPANVLAVAIFPLFMALGLLTLLLYLAGLPVGRLCRIEDGVCSLLQGISDAAASASADIPVNLNAGAVGVLALAAALVCLALLLYTRIYKPTAAAAGLFCLVLFVACGRPEAPVHLVVDSSGRGSVIMFAGPGRAGVFAKNSAALSPALRRYCRTIGAEIEEHEMPTSGYFAVGGYKLTRIARQTFHSNDADILLVDGGYPVKNLECRKYVLLGAEIKPEERAAWTAACADAGVAAVDLRHRAFYLEIPQ